MRYVMKMKEYDTYIFDLYGTLIDIRTDEWKACFWKKNQKLFSQYGADYQWEELRDAYFKTVGKKEEKMKEEGHHIEIDIADVFCSLLYDKGAAADDETIGKIAEAFRKNSICHIRLYAGAKDLLKTLHDLKKKVFLLSNAQELFTMKELKDLGISDLFDGIFISSACGYRKPDPAFMEALIKRYGLDVKKCLMIGNDLYDDVGIADMTGMDSYYVEDGLSSKRKTDSFATYVQTGMDLSLLKKRIVTACKRNTR